MRILVTFGLLCFTISSFGQGLFEESTEKSKSSLEINGYARGVVAGGSEKYDLTNVFSEFCITPRFNKGKTSLFADLRIREAYLYNENNLTTEAKELYLTYKAEHADFSLGNQIVSWGRTDGFNPTNIITPTDYFFISPEPDDQRLSNFMLRSKIHFKPEIELDLIGIPFYKPSVYRYDLFLSDDNVTFLDPVFPSTDIDNGSLAARLNFELPKIGFSLSYSTGYSPFYGFDISNINWNADGTYSIDNIPKTYHHSTFGSDISIPFNKLILRAEAAYQHTDNYVDQISSPNPHLSYVTGLEFNIAGFTPIFQYIGKYVRDYIKWDEPVLTDPNDPIAQMAYAEALVYYESELFNRKVFDQQEETNHAFMLIVNKDFLHNTLHTECSFYYNVTSESYMIRPMLKYKIDDNLTANIGGSYMHGPENSLFAYSSPVLNGLFISLKANF